MASYSTYYVGCFIKRAEKTVDGKRLKCDCPLRRSIFVVFHHYYFFSRSGERGGGGGAGGIEKSDWNPQVLPFKRKLLSSQSFPPCSLWLKSIFECKHSMNAVSCLLCSTKVIPSNFWFNGWNSVMWRFIQDLFSCAFTRNYLLFMQYSSKSKWNCLHFNLYIKSLSSRCILSKKNNKIKQKISLILGLGGYLKINL